MILPENTLALLALVMMGNNPTNDALQRQDSYTVVHQEQDCPTTPPTSPPDSPRK